MAISVEREPGILSFAGNSTALFLKSTGVVTPGVTSINEVKHRGYGWRDGFSITLEWGDTIVRMTAKDAPDDSGLQFPVGGELGSDIPVYLNTILPYFQSNFLIDESFTVEVVGNSLRFTAKKQVTFTTLKTSVNITSKYLITLTHTKPSLFVMVLRTTENQTLSIL